MQRVDLSSSEEYMLRIPMQLMLVRPIFVLAGALEGSPVSLTPAFYSMTLQGVSDE